MPPLWMCGVCVCVRVVCGVCVRVVCVRVRVPALKVERCRGGFFQPNHLYLCKENKTADCTE